MNPVLHAMNVVKGQVQDLEERYEGYHVDLVRRLTEVIAKQEAGLSDARRRIEVREIVVSFGSAVAAREESD